MQIGPEKTMQIISNHTAALNVWESPKFSRPKGNRGRGTRW